MIQFKNGDRIRVIKDVINNLHGNVALARVGDTGTIIGDVFGNMVQVEFDEPNPARIFDTHLNMFLQEIELLENEIEVSFDPSTVEDLL